MARMAAQSDSYFIQNGFVSLFYQLYFLSPQAEVKEVDLRVHERIGFFRVERNAIFALDVVFLWRLNKERVLNQLSADVVLNALHMESLAARPPLNPLPFPIWLQRPHLGEPVVGLNHFVVTHSHVLGQGAAPDDDLIHAGVFFYAADFTGSAVVWSLVWVAFA